jgi:hypothetical protein
MDFFQAEEYIYPMKQGMLRTFAIVVMIFLVSLPSLSAQIPRSSITFAFAGFLYDESDFDSDELSVLENRVTSHLLEISREENYSILPIENRQPFRSAFPFGENALAFFDRYPESVPPRSRGVIIGEANRIGARVYLDLHMYSVSTGELLLAHSSDFAGIEQSISGARTMVLGLFGFEEDRDSSGIAQGIRSQAGSDVEWQRPSMSFIAGTWQGDTGIGAVTIETDGSGFANLSGSDRMRIRVTIDGEQVRVRQDEPNAPKLYLSLFPYSIATQIVNLARPMSWEFRLSADGELLIGEKFTSYFYIEDGEISRVDNTYSRDATWTRID